MRFTLCDMLVNISYGIVLQTSAILSTGYSSLKRMAVSFSLHSMSVKSIMHISIQILPMMGAALPLT